MNTKILVAEDDEDIRAIVQAVLESDGFKTVMAINGTETLALAQKEKPDALILDLSMPEVDGWEVARELRAHPSTKDLPILALTAHTMAGDCERALKAGCNAFLAKPFDPDELLKATHRLLKAQPPAKKQ